MREDVPMCLRDLEKKVRGMVICITPLGTRVTTEFSTRKFSRHGREGTGAAVVKVKETGGKNPGIWAGGGGCGTIGRRGEQSSHCSGGTAPKKKGDGAHEKWAPEKDQRVLSNSEGHGSE